MATDFGSNPAEPKALNNLFSYLVNSIDTAALLPDALSKNLITDHQRTECYIEADPYKKAQTFVGYLQRAVNADYSNYYTFVRILKETGQEKIAFRLRGKAETSQDVYIIICVCYRPFRCESRLVQKSINTPIFRALLEGKGLPKVALLPKKHSDSRLDS